MVRKRFGILVQLALLNSFLTSSMITAQYSLASSSQLVPLIASCPVLQSAAVTSVAKTKLIVR